MENIRGREAVESGELCERKNGRGVDPNRNWDIHWGHKEKGEQGVGRKQEEGWQLAGRHWSAAGAGPSLALGPLACPTRCQLLTRSLPLPHLCRLRSSGGVPRGGPFQ